MIEWSLAAAAAAESISAIIVAAPPGAEAEVERALAKAAAGVSAGVVSGGASRADSVRAGVESAVSELVLVHDAARPLVEPALFDAVAARLESRPDAAAVIAATPLADTVKRDRGGGEGRRGGLVVAETVERERLWAAQTPQGFRVEALLAAQRDAADAGRLAEATDEAQLIEWAGGIVLLEPAPAANLKVTTGADLRLAEALLAADRRV